MGYASLGCLIFLPSVLYVLFLAEVFNSMSIESLLKKLQHKHLYAPAHRTWLVCGRRVLDRSMTMTKAQLQEGCTLQLRSRLVSRLPVMLIDKGLNCQ